MKITYFPETDTLAIDFADRPSADTDEIADGVTIDYDAEGRVIGIDIEHATSCLDLGQRELHGFPGQLR